MSRTPNSTDRYFQEVVSYGGLPATRAEVVRDLRERCGASDQQVGAYLMGLDRRMELEAVPA